MLTTPRNAAAVSGTYVWNAWCAGYRRSCAGYRRSAAHVDQPTRHAQASEEELGGTLCCALANRLRITKPEAGRRSAEAKP